MTGTTTISQPQLVVEITKELKCMVVKAVALVVFH